MFEPTLFLPHFRRVAGPKDSRGRTSWVFEPAPDPVPVIGIDPTGLTATDTQTDFREVETLTLIMPTGTYLAAHDQVAWADQRWDVVKVQSYDHGPWHDFGGNIATIERRLTND